MAKVRRARGPRAVLRDAFSSATGLLVAVVGTVLRVATGGRAVRSASDRHPWFPSSTGYQSLLGLSSAFGGHEPVTLENAQSSRPRQAPQQAWSPRVFDDIEWRRFEAVCEALFVQAGFGTRFEPQASGKGIDIWLFSRHAKGPAAVVQCKHWRGGQAVGLRHVREFFAAMIKNGVPRGTFATSSTFTSEALRFAKENGINALDGEGLLRLIARRTPAQQDALLSIAYEGAYWQPTCASCGLKMVERVKRDTREAFWSCANYPKCRSTMAMRAR